MKTFVVSRFLRLYPIFWFSIPFGILTSWKIWGLSLSTSDIVKNLTMVPTLFGAPLIQGLYWTLAVELAFYFACALLYLILGDLRPEATLTAFSIFFLLDAVGVRPFGRLYFLLAFMFLSASLRGWYELRRKSAEPSPRLRRLEKTGIVLVLVFLAPIVVHLAMSFIEPENSRWDKGWANAIGIVTFLLALKWSRPSPWLTALGGMLTYSMYLLHPVAFKPLIKWTATGTLPPMRLELMILLATTLTILYSLVSHHLIERPCNGLAKRLISNIRKQK